MPQYGAHVQGNTTLAAVGNSNIIAAQGTGVVTNLQQLVVTISVWTASAIVSVDDGTTTFFAWEAATAGGGQPPMVDFGEKGIKWGTNKAIRLTVAGGNCTAFAVAKGYTRG